MRKDNGCQLKGQSFSNSKALMNTSYYLKYTKVLGKFVPIEQIYIDEFEKGNKTKVKISGIVTGNWTTRYLQRRTWRI